MMPINPRVYSGTQSGGGLSVGSTGDERALGAFASVDDLEAAMRTQYQIEIPVVHRFADHVYAREITIPAGTLLTGKIHKTRQLNIISAGSIQVWEEGRPTRRIDAPHSFISEAGARRVGLALTETVWTTIHGTDETDIDRLEAELIEPHDTISTLPSEDKWPG